MSYIFLYGPPGAGKSTIGKQLADNLRLPFIDLDHLIETQAGMSVPQIIEERGEAVFRDMETAALKTLAPDGMRETIVALGGGALWRDENRSFAEKHGRVILLRAAVDTLLERLESDVAKRPLLTGNLREQLTSLLEKRESHYNSFSLKFDVDEKNVEQIVCEIQVVLGRHHLSAMGDTDVYVGSVEQFRHAFHADLIVADENAAKFHLQKIKDMFGGRIKSILLPSGEEHKNLETVSHLWRAFLESELDRHSIIVALGGGVTCDLTGFAASTYLRGIDWIALPTTLLAMVDASLGGKTGFDLPEGKNLIGSFHPPKLVFADPSLLLTLTDRELRSGMAEVVKHGIIADADLFAWCSRGLDWVKTHLEEIVKRAMAVKIRIIEEDPYEKGRRAVLNLGHTVGHAVEWGSRFELRHGEAIAIGMSLEARYAERIGLAKHGVSDKIAKTLQALELPTHLPKELPRREILRAMRLDKKRTVKTFRLALPVEIGKVELVDVSDLEAVLDEE